MDKACTHERAEMIARRDGVDYVRCVRCGQVFEADDLEAPPLVGEDEEVPTPSRKAGSAHDRRSQTRA